MPTSSEKPAKVRNKTAFVNSLPESLSAKEVVDRAKKVGLTISDKYVYVVRSNARRKKGTARVVRKPAVAATGPSGDKEFRRLVLEHGVRWAEQHISTIKKNVG